MGVVYRAHDDRLDRDVALKLLPPAELIESAARKRFHKEALTLSKLNHPNIATVHDFDTQDGVDFLVEEFIDGVSLDVMLNSGPLTEKEIIQLGSQLAEGLAAAHTHNVIHRDLKPANVRMTSDARIKILDFGLAVILRRETSPTDVTQSFSAGDALSGTLPYMAPEQLLRGKLDARTDIWAAGCVLFEMATGRRPFLGSGPALTDAILHQSPPAISKLNPTIGAAIQAVIQKCLDKDPDRRYASAHEIAVDLRRAGSPLAQTSTGLTWKRWIGPITALAALLAVIAIGMRLNAVLRHTVDKQYLQETSVPIQPAPAESYLMGLKYLERWDKPSNLDAAVGSFQQAVTANPNFALGFSGLAEAHWAKYRLEHDSRWIDEAEKDCRRAAELNAELPAVYVMLARVHNGRGQSNLALQEIQQALRLEPLNPDAWLEQASVYASMGQVERAESTYKKATVLRPQDWNGHYELGVFYYRQRRYSDAAAQFDLVLASTPDNAMAHATLGGMMQLLGKDADAESHLRQSIDLQPGYAAYTNLGALYYRQRRWAESVEMTRKALDINANDWRAWSNLGLALLWLNENDKASEAFRHEFARLDANARLGADDAEIDVERALLHSKWKQRAKAVPLIEAALARAPEDPGVLASAGEAYDNLGERSRALELVQKALARGWTIKQLENDPGQRDLLSDPRFRKIEQEFNKKVVQPQP